MFSFTLISSQKNILINVLYLFAGYIYVMYICERIFRMCVCTYVHIDIHTYVD